MTSIFDRRLESVTETDIIKSYRYACRITSQELPLSQTLPILQEPVKMDLGTVSIDLGALVTSLEEEGGDLHAFLERELTDVIGAGAQVPKTDIILYGFGRTGCLLVRILPARGAPFSGPRLRVIVVRQNGEDDVVKRAPLLRHGSVHGAFDGTISIGREGNIIWANNTPIQVIYSNNLVTVDYIAYDINDAAVINNIGRWRDREGPSQHLRSKGVVKVLLTAPGKDDVKDIAYGINHDIIKNSDNILSVASCTTNGTAPVLEVVSGKWGVESGHVETVYSLASGQGLIDNFHKGSRRGHAATPNMALTETGATKVVAEALSGFEGKLTGSTTCALTPDVSMAVLNLTLDTEVDRDEANSYLREVSLKSVLRQQIDCIHSPEVIFTDFVGSIHADIVDGLATIANDKHLVLYVWYSNEFGYSSRVIHIAEEIANARPRVYPRHRHIDEL